MIITIISVVRYFNTRRFRHESYLFESVWDGDGVGPSAFCARPLPHHMYTLVAKELCYCPSAYESLMSFASEPGSNLHIASKFFRGFRPMFYQFLRTILIRSH